MHDSDSEDDILSLLRRDERIRTSWKIELSEKKREYCKKKIFAPSSKNE